MKLNTLLEICFLSLCVLFFITSAAPASDTTNDATDENYIEESEEVTTPHPALNKNTFNQTLEEQAEAIQQCWMDEAVGHGPGSPDPWIFGNNNGTRTFTSEECAKITTYFDHCHCYMSVIEYHGKTAKMVYYVYVGAYESQVDYKVTAENGL